jgi:hypothetical protein
VSFTEADYVEAYVGYAKHTNQIQGTRKLIAIILVVMAGSVIAAWPVTPGVWTATALALLASLYLVRKQWAWVGKRAFAQLPEARRTFEVAVTEDGMLAKGPKAEVRYAWSTMVGWLETENLVVMIQKGGVGDLCPKRAFEDDELPALRALLDEHIVVPPPVTPEKVAKKARGVRVLLLWIILIAAFVAIYQLATVPA